MIKTKHHHNLRGTCGQSFGCLKSQFRSKLSCIAVSIPKIIGEAFPYISCISLVLWRPACFCGSSAASSEPAKYKVTKLQCQRKLYLFPWWSTTLSSLVTILVSSLHSTCALHCKCNNSTDHSPPSEGNSPRVWRFYGCAAKYSTLLVWQFATGYLVPDVSKEHSAFIFTCLQIHLNSLTFNSDFTSWLLSTIYTQRIGPLQPTWMKQRFIPHAYKHPRRHKVNRVRDLSCWNPTSQSGTENRFRPFKMKAYFQNTENL